MSIYEGFKLMVNGLIPPLAYRPKEAAKALAISERALWQLTADRKVPFIKVGKMTLYPVAELTTWLSQQVQGRLSSEGKVNV